MSSDSLNKDYFNHSSDLSNLETIKSKILAFYDEMNQKLQLHNSYFQQKFIHACMAYVEEHLQETITPWICCRICQYESCLSKPRF